MSPMLHSKPKGYGPLVPERKIFKGFLSYMGMAATFDHVTQMRQANFHSLYPLRLLVVFGFDWPRVSEEKMFEEFSLKHDPRAIL